jgi:hypothetical protein
MPFNVLVFPGGSEIGLEIHKSLRFCKEVNLHSAAINNSNHAPYVYQRHHVIPSIYKSDWIQSLNHLIAREKITHIFPAYDEIIVALAKNNEIINAKIITSPLDTCLITRSKIKTYDLFQGYLPVPEMYTIKDIPGYPVFLKPECGQGSEGTARVNSASALKAAIDFDPSLMILEYLPGEEFTIDCFSHRNQGLLFCSGRSRTRIKSGIAMASTTIDNPVFRQFAQVITERLVLHGAWFFQVKKDNMGNMKLLEIAPRIAGTMALHRAKGINFPLLSLYESDSLPVRIHTGFSGKVSIDRALSNSYCVELDFDTVYVDLDDTLVFRNKINTLLVQLLYQFLNEGKELVLVTRHRYALDETLKKFRLQSLFDQVVHLDNATPKSTFIRNQRSLFIDDSFRERLEVQDKCGIPTFDCSMLELLLDRKDI